MFDKIYGGQILLSGIVDDKSKSVACPSMEDRERKKEGGKERRRGEEEREEERGREGEMERGKERERGRERERERKRGRERERELQTHFVTNYRLYYRE